MKSAFVSLVTVLFLAGCGPQASGVAPAASSEIDSEEDELSASSALMGAWKAEEGTLLGIVFAKDGIKRVFSAEQQVWCFKAPCHAVTLEGTWTVRLGKLYLTEGGNKVKYGYSVSNGVLSLTDPDQNGRPVGRLVKQTTWCARSSDCALQQWTHASCTGNAVCTAEQTCGCSCGAPLSAGFGDACSDGAKCSSGLACEAESGACWPAPACDLDVAKSCAGSAVCTVSGDAGACLPFAHGVTVGRGYSCGGSIGVSCARGLTCNAPVGKIGGTGTCG